jgi:predicted DNA-binding transcriptional regulator AlpA
MKILRKKTTADRYGVSTRTIDRWSTDPKYADMNFPKPVPLGENSVGFLEHEIDADIECRAALRGGADKRSEAT